MELLKINYFIGGSESIVRTKILFLTSLMLLLLIGCSKIEDSISKEEAKKLVIEKHTNNNGTPTILSIKIKNNAYYIEWENKGNKASGIDKVTEEGEIEMVESEIE